MDPEAAPKPTPSGTAARMRRYRNRRRNGELAIRLILSQSEVDELVDLGYLASERRRDREAISRAIDWLLNDARIVFNGNKHAKTNAT